MTRENAFGRAAAELRGQADYGRLLWSVNGCRAYQRGTSVLTLLGPGGTVVYIVEGVDLDQLR